MDKKISTSDIRANVKKKRVREIRFLTENTFVLRFDRDNLQFYAGQHLVVGTKGSLNQREYSIYSSEKQDYLEILVREVPGGNVSAQLSRVQPGDLIEVDGPFGSFIMEPRELYVRKNVFIASGTGIAPFHSFVTSYPGINYVVLHGIRKPEDAYEKNEYDPTRYIPCVSEGSNNRFNGRVTGYLPDFADEPDMDYYICGNSNMILDVNKILKNKGVTSGRIFIEVYF